MNMRWLGVVTGAALMALSSVSALAQPKLIAAKSEITFASRQMGGTVDGSFARFDAQIAFDPKKPEAGKIGFTIDLSSVSIGAPETMAELRKPNWFDSARTPNATFQSNAIKAVGAGKFEVVGTLTIKGQAKPLTVPVTLTQQGLPSGQTRADGAFAIKRLEWRIGDGEWSDVSLVANDVQVRVKLLITGMAPL